jgi:POT family proton-dependent oligopeptide transporter
MATETDRLLSHSQSDGSGSAVGAGIPICDNTDDAHGLRRVPDRLPTTVWLVTAIEVCDKFAYYGLSGPLQNYLQNDRDDPLRPGSIGTCSLVRPPLTSVYPEPKPRRLFLSMFPC